MGCSEDPFRSACVLVVERATCRPSFARNHAPHEHASQRGSRLGVAGSISSA